jgi:hypothetical protein
LIKGEHSLTRETPPPDNTPSASPPFPHHRIAALNHRQGTSCGPVPSCPHSASRVCRADRRAASGTSPPQSGGSHPLPGALSTHTVGCRLCWNCTTGRHGWRCREYPNHRRIAAGCAQRPAGLLFRSRCIHLVSRAPAVIPGLLMTR